MPIKQSAKKALRQSKKRAKRNSKNKKAIKDVVKEFQRLISAQKKEEAKKLLPLAYKAIDKAAKKGIFKRNTASRKKSRLAKLIKV